MSAQAFPTKQVARLTGHNGQVLALTYSSGSGQYLLTAGTDRTIHLYNPSTRALIAAFTSHGYTIHDLAIAQSNATFASAGDDKSIFLWDVASARTTRRLPGHYGRVDAVRFAGADDSLLLSGGFDGTVRLWDLRQRGEREVARWAEAKDAVSAVDVADAEVLVGSVDGRVRCYDVRAGKCEVDVLGAPVTSVGLTARRDAYLAGTLDSSLRLMDRRDGKLLQRFADEGEFKNAEFKVRATLAMGDACVVSGAEDGRVFVWDVLTGRVLHRLRHEQGLLGNGGAGASATTRKKNTVVSAVAWNQMRKQWASAGGDGSVVIWGTE